MSEISLSKHERKIAAIALDFMLNELTDEDIEWAASDDWKRMMITLATQLLDKVFPNYLRSIQTKEVSDGL